MSENNKRSIYAVVTFKAEVLVEVEHGGLAEPKAREYLQLNPDVLQCTLLSCERSKIKRLKKLQGGAFFS